MSVSKYLPSTSNVDFLCFAGEVKQTICLEESKSILETSSTDFEKIKQLVLTNHNLKEFLTDVENKFRNNIDGREEEMKLLANELKEISEKVKVF